MKKVLISLLSLVSLSASADEFHPWFNQHLSTYSLAKSVPHLTLVKSVYKDSFKTYKNAVSNELANEQTFETIRKEILSKETNKKKLAEVSPPALVSSENGKAHFQSDFKSTRTGEVLFSVTMTCVDKNLPPVSEETHGEYVYYAASDLYTCFATGLK